ncbi:fasciclin domain-containing protein [Rubellimicrobium roseum]|uniref:Fasciclin domain-containing protein n=1 Tax=Rubellimicrobium roseum TaxID=687525 RepID=A0A5C4NBH1_9RHOB|nr:fasciclin domain-containing protein [Rubellimicrobium roseum]TNC70981.1 fasciclin domain-containing protein [Rubellimicrobium roseum]
MRTTLLAVTAAVASFGTLAFADNHEAAAEGTILETAAAAGSFTTLAAAVEAAGLTETLSGEGPFTVFAPTDEAFAALPEGTLDELLANPEQLSSILTYHVVSGEVTSDQLTEGQEVTTVNGAPATITLEGGPMINGANITQPDVQASNGVIHVIDAVILPPEGEAASQ